MGRLKNIEKFEESYGWISVIDAKYLLSEVKRLRGAIEKHIIEFDRLMKEMPPNRERGMKLAESVGDLQKALKEEI